MTNEQEITNQIKKTGFKIDTNIKINTKKFKYRITHKTDTGSVMYTDDFKDLPDFVDRWFKTFIK